MSYCRWSSDDYQCDVYVYEDVSGGWTTHVGTGRYVITEPLPDLVILTPDTVHEYVEREAEVSRILRRSTVERVGLPHDGETYNDPTPGACADRLEDLRALGYHVPQYAIDALREEA